MFFFNQNYLPSFDEITKTREQKMESLSRVRWIERVAILEVTIYPFHRCIFPVVNLNRKVNFIEAFFHGQFEVGK